MNNCLQETDIGYVPRLVSSVRNRSGQGRRKLRIDQEVEFVSRHHTGFMPSSRSWGGRDQNGMVHLGRGEGEAGSDIFLLQVWVIGQDFGFRNARGQEFQHVLHADAHPADAGPSAALGRIERDT